MEQHFLVASTRSEGYWIMCFADVLVCMIPDHLPDRYAVYAWNFQFYCFSGLVLVCIDCSAICKVLHI